MVAGGWDRSAHLLGKTFHQRRHPRLRTFSLCDFCREIYNSSDRFARIPDSAVGGMLSLVLLPVLGLCSLFLRKQLLDSRVWRYHAPTELADVGAAGEHCRRVDVRNFHKHFVRDRYPTRRPRKTFSVTMCNSRQLRQARTAYFLVLISSEIGRSKPRIGRCPWGRTTLCRGRKSVFSAKCRFWGSTISAFLTHAQNLCRQFKCLHSSEFGMLLALLSTGKGKRVFRLLIDVLFDLHLGGHCETLRFQNVCELS